MMDFRKIRLLFYIEYVRIFIQAMYTYFLRNFLSRVVLPFNSRFLFKHYKDSFWTMAKTRLSLFQTLSCLKNMLVWGNIQNCSKKGKKGLTDTGRSDNQTVHSNSGAWPS